MRDGSVPWQAQLNDALRAERREVYRHERVQEVVEQWGEVEYARFEHTQPMDLDTLLEAVRSRSYVILLDPAERDELLERTEQVWRANPGIDSMVYETEVYRITPRADRGA
jgi:hypothetical protein